MIKKDKCINCKCTLDCIPYTLAHGFGSQYDMELWDFCSIKCLLIYIIKKITKDE